MANPITFAFAAALATALPAATWAQDFSGSPSVTLRLSSASPAGMEDSRALTDMAEYLSEATDGTVTLKPFFASALFDEIKGMSAAQSGLVDMAIACTCNMTKQTDSMLFSDLPYLWNEMDNGREVWDSEIGEQISEEMRENLGLRALAFTPSGGGYRILWNNSGEIRTPEDAKDVKIRTTATPLEQDFWRRVGAIPTPVDIGETYSALQQDLVDGEHLQPAWLTLLKHDEVVKYGTEIGAVAVYRVLVINDDSYDKMDEAQKAAFEEAVQLFEDRAYGYNHALRDQEIAKFEAGGGQIYTPTEEELEQWREIGRSLWDSDTVTSTVPAELIQKVLDAQD
ncbi:TRAP transporter substrate-binding protein [uncultured Jannaschia sp.]|uniref:TRAP transporter substrate-binding protein n=1 Tax=uncultured Jannaschia sp. TaxID=293347 RepID=UPI00261AEC8D|nr:TRAP transporter substrate-binding protein [uncultured Jannaschia sp.]